MVNGSNQGIPQRMFKKKEDSTVWAVEQFNKYGIRQPETLTEQEPKDACPEVPEFIANPILKY